MDDSYDVGVVKVALSVEVVVCVNVEGVPSIIVFVCVSEAVGEGVEVDTHL